MTSTVALAVVSHQSGIMQATSAND